MQTRNSSPTTHAPSAHCCTLSTGTTGTAVSRQEPWTSTTCWSIPTSSSATIPMCSSSTSSISAMCSSMSTRTPTVPSISSSNNSLPSTVISASWAMMPNQSILSVAPISTTFWICSTRSPTPSSSSWSRTIARRRTLWMPPIRSLRRTRIKYARQSSAKTTEARNSFSLVPTPTWRNPIKWLDVYSRFTTTRVTTTATLPSSTAPMRKAARSRKPCANATSSIASTEACRSISARRSRISSAICDS